jgi:hypothetical protein
MSEHDIDKMVQDKPFRVRLSYNAPVACCGTVLFGPRPTGTSSLTISVTKESVLSMPSHGDYRILRVKLAFWDARILPHCAYS